MDDRVARCLLVAKVLVADGIMTPAEREFLLEAMQRMGLDEPQRKQVIELEGWEEAEPVVAALGPDEKRALLDELTQAALVDGKLGANETETVGRIAAALGID